MKKKIRTKHRENKIGTILGAYNGSYYHWQDRKLAKSLHFMIHGIEIGRYLIFWSFEFSKFIRFDVIILSEVLLPSPLLGLYTEFIPSFDRSSLYSVSMASPIFTSSTCFGLVLPHFQKNKKLNAVTVELLFYSWLAKLVTY